MDIDKKFVNSFVKVTERGAYGASLFKGKNDKIGADKAAVDEMRKEINKINMKGRIVIGEGEMDEAPMLYIDEKVGTMQGEEFDIAVDPLEGTNFAAKICLMLYLCSQLVKKETFLELQIYIWKKLQ